MPRQATNTLLSLSPGYQQGVEISQYEVLVVENESDNVLNAETVTGLPANFSYFKRKDPGVSPAAAINFGIAQSRGEYIGLMIDGARMLSPGVLAAALDSFVAYPNAFVNVPGYYLTEQGADAEESAATDAADAEQRMLEQSNWQQQGHCLFDTARFSNGNRHGYLRPWFESTTFFVNRWALEKVGGADESFQLVGGGALLLHMFRSLGLLKELKYIVLAGEGNFHQYHGGVSTRRGENRDALVKQFKQQLDAKWPGGFKALSREATLIGKIPEQALRFLQLSSELASARNRNFYREGKSIWPDDDELELYHGETCDTSKRLG